jgi:predicted nucleic acid-binding protein
MSVITEIELLCWKAPTDKDLEVLRQFIDNALVFELEKDIKLKTAAIRKAHKIKLPDAIIAATALTYNLTLLTRNVSDFKNIDDLNLINPHKQ